MAIRTLPFGYRMSQGKICIVENEARIVQRIFASYAEGHSYDDLTRWLNGQSIPYLPGRPWNKNVVARILRDERYLGSCDTYPPIIPAEMFGCRVPNAAGRLNLPQIKDIRILARCGVCGEPVRRERENTWRCPHCMASAVPTTDQQFIDAVAELLQGLCGHPDMVRIPASPDDDDSGVLAAENELAHELEAVEFDEAAAKTKALSLAAARFDALGSEDYETMRIQHILAQMEPSAELNTVLLRQITSAILISPTGEVRLKLKNKQIVERSTFQ